MKYFYTLLVFLFFFKSISQNVAYEKSGDILYIALPSIALASTYIWNDEDKPVYQFLKSYAVSAVLVTAIKRTVNKSRPDGYRYSFPSGHTSSSFTGAAFLQRRYGWKIGAPAYLLAGYVGWTRVYANRHDAWDVLAGAAVGIGSVYLFTKPYEGKKVKITASPYSNGLLIALNYTF